MRRDQAARARLSATAAAFGRRGFLGAGMAGAGLLGAGLALPSGAQAQAWPTRPVRIVVPFTPGGSNDAIARPLAERLHARFGQPFVVENRGGAGSAVGVALVAQAPADGYTLLLTTSSVAAIGAVQGTGFDPTVELDAVALLASAPLIVVVPRDSPFRTMQDLVRADRARPNTLHYASAGPGSTTHMTAVLFNLRAEATLQHVPYRGTAPALTDVAAGRVDVMFTTMAAAAGPIRGGLLRILAYTGEARPEGSPPGPSVRETGIDYEATIWWGLLAPRGLPPPLLQALNGAVNAALAEPALARHLAQEGAVPSPVGTDEFARLVAAETATMRRVVAAGGIKVD